MLPQHLWPIVYHHYGRYFVLDDMHANVTACESFAGAVNSDNSLCQTYCPLTQEHGGIYMLIYSRNIERVSPTPPPFPTSVRASITLPLTPTDTNVSSYLLSQHHVDSSSATPSTTAIDSDLSTHTPPSCTTQPIVQAERDCKIPFEPYCTSPPHTTPLQVYLTIQANLLACRYPRKYQYFLQDLPVRLLGRHIYFSFKEAMELTGHQKNINKHGYDAIDKLSKRHDIQSDEAAVDRKGVSCENIVR